MDGVNRLDLCIFMVMKYFVLFILAFAALSWGDPVSCLQLGDNVVKGVSGSRCVMNDFTKPEKSIESRVIMQYWKSPAVLVMFNQVRNKGEQGKWMTVEVVNCELLDDNKTYSCSIQNALAKEAEPTIVSMNSSKMVALVKQNSSNADYEYLFAK